jgi:hypothetical protein
MLGPEEARDVTENKMLNCICLAVINEQLGGIAHGKRLLGDAIRGQIVVKEINVHACGREWWQMATNRKP